MALPRDHVDSVCKIYTHETCRYLICGSKGFECAKHTSLKQQIDARVHQMNAKGDNCEGVRHDERQDKKEA